MVSVTPDTHVTFITRPTNHVVPFVELTFRERYVAVFKLLTPIQEDIIPQLCPPFDLLRKKRKMRYLLLLFLRIIIVAAVIAATVRITPAAAKVNVMSGESSVAVPVGAEGSEGSLGVSAGGSPPP